MQHIKSTGTSAADTELNKSRSSSKGRHEHVRGRQSHISHRGAQWLHGSQKCQCIDTDDNKMSVAAAEEPLREARYKRSLTYSRLLSAHDKIGMMLRHCDSESDTC